MTLIGRRKKKNVPEQVLGYVKLGLKGLVAQRIARNAYKGYKWTRRLPFLLAGGAIVAFVARKAMQKKSDASDAGITPSAEHPSTTATAATSPPATTPTTPTPTGSPTAVTPAPTAAADGAPATESEASGAAPSGDDAEAKS